MDEPFARAGASVAELIVSGKTREPVFQEAVDRADELDVAAVLELVSHPDARVRRDVVASLPDLCGGDGPSAAMVEATIALSLDGDPRVRDWACFALGTQWTCVDTEALREALAARLDDIDVDTRCEALLGLAYRRDPRAFPYVRRALSRSSGVVYLLEMVAAGALSDPRLHALVEGHQRGWADAAGARTAYLAARLTDPAGPGEAIVDDVAQLYRRRAHRLPLGPAATAGWRTMSELLEIAPWRAPEFLRLVLDRVVGDHAATQELRERSALAQLAEGNAP